MKRLFFIMMLVMMFFAVEGYAQRQRGERSQTSHQVVGHQQSRPLQQGVRPQSSQQSVGRQQPQYTRRPQHSHSSQYGVGSQQSQHGNRSNSPQHGVRPQHHQQPQYGVRPQHGNGINHRHSHFTHGERHYKHLCNFNVWRWVSYLDYHRRFVCHANYVDRYYDTMLGYYVYGTLQTPKSIVVGRLELKRSNTYLSTCNDGYYKSYHVYEPAHLVYNAGYRTVDVTVGEGLIIVNMFDDRGNSATYYL